MRINEPFRADHLNRVLYKCADCGAEGQMTGRGTLLTCGACGKVYELDEYGTLCAKDGKTTFSHVPDWFAWQRECVRKELENGTYRLDCAVRIYMLVNTKCLYDVGHGRLIHTTDGIYLSGCNGDLDYFQPPQASYSLNADYYWYEIGDVIGIGNHEVLYYCFPQNAGDVVAKRALLPRNCISLPCPTSECRAKSKQFPNNPTVWLTHGALRGTINRYSTAKERSKHVSGKNESRYVQL